MTGRSWATVVDSRDLARLVVQLLTDDRERGEPPLGHGFTPGQEHAVLARHAGAPGAE